MWAPCRESLPHLAQGILFILTLVKVETTLTMKSLSLKRGFST